MFISVTRLRLRSVRFLPGFALQTIPSLREIRTAPGFLDGRLLPDAHQTFWTVTRWTSAEAMRAWRGAGAHGKAMKSLAHWCDEASIAHWDETGPAEPFPEWPICHARMTTGSGRPSRVDRPSPDHAAGIIPPPAPARLARSFAFAANPQG